MKKILLLIFILFCWRGTMAQQFALDSIFKQYNITDTVVKAKTHNIIELIDKHNNEFSRDYKQFKKTGADLIYFKHNYSQEKSELKHYLADETNPFLRAFYYVSYLELGNSIYGATIESGIASCALEAITPQSLLWSYDPALIGVAVRFSDKSKAVLARYVDHVIAENPDPWVKQVTFTRLSPERKIAIGKKLPEFTAVDLHDSLKVYNNKNLKGKVYLIDLWATWCGPCIEEMPGVERAYRKFRSRNFEILSISLDGQRQIALDFITERNAMKWKTALNIKKNSVLKSFDLYGIPMLILIDQNGYILDYGDDLRGKGLEVILSKILAPAN